MNGILRLIVGVAGIILGIWLFRSTYKKHKKIDTESIAVVKCVQDLGRDDGRKVYAIRYDVNSSEPFELLETPCKKALAPGTKRSVFYEKDDPKHNYYFKTIWQLDRRFIMPCSILFACLVITVSTIVEIVG
jgi:hypothetical protein